jgi:hypothetical protein
MDDRFLHDQRRDPNPGFEARLHASLKAQAHEPVAPAAAWRPLAVAAGAVVVIAGLFTFPSVRASAQSFLDMFRVRTFTPVAVDPERFRVLESGSVDLQRLMSKNVEVVKEAGPGHDAASVGEAARVAGYSVLQPSYLPQGLEAGAIHVSDESVVRLTADASILVEVLRLLDLDDVRVPESLDGAQVQVRMPPAVQMRYTRDGREVRFTQSLSPEVRLPPAMDLEDLGEIALRIAGLPAGEARRLAGSIDWHTTLLVPVPTTARSFRTVTVNGQQGVLIEAREGTADIPGGRHGAVAIMWADGEKVYALAGNAHAAELLEMANSVR